MAERYLYGVTDVTRRCRGFGEYFKKILNLSILFLFLSLFLDNVKEFHKWNS